MDICKPDDPHVGPSTLQIPPEALEQARENLQSLLHKTDDAWIRVVLPFIYDLVNVVLKEDPQRRKRLADKDLFLSNVQHKGENQVFETLRKIVKNNSWEELLEDDIFLKQPDTEIHEQEHRPFSAAAEGAWETDFKGNAAEVLLTTISNSLRKERGNIYARHASIVNSSGTGKSRMVDQMALEIITVPMCLRADGSRGYPPPDQHLRDWLSGTTDRVLVEKKVEAFIYSLLTILLEHLKRIKENNQPMKAFGKSKAGETDVDVIQRQKFLAHAFRTNMSEGQSFKASNQYRQSFYDAVIDEANKFIKRSATEGRHGRAQMPPKPKSPRLSSPAELVEQAGRELCQFIDPQGLLDSDHGSRRPLVILAFDEAHTLTYVPKDKSWTVFTELCRTLQRLVDRPIFSLFLSTAGKLSPEILEDPSNRIAHHELKILDPITEISFDDIAHPADEGQVLLEQVVELDWMSHLGRPLFGSYYDRLKDEQAVLHFAKNKLLIGQSTLDASNAPGVLACLSVRFGLEFNEDVFSSRVARTQVERHMRLCIGATTGFERLVTLAGSEPFLAEAAYELMRFIPDTPVRCLASHSDLNCVDRGRRGELVAALIIMQARDAAVLSARARRVSVCEFIQALLPDLAYEELSKSTPRFWLEGEDRLSFIKTFEHHSMWFNHVIKIERSRLIHVESLWRFITRGAMIICTHCQYGVDIVLPVVCDMTKPLSRDNMSAILIQVKNDESYGPNIDKTLFDHLNPFELGLFSKGQSKPVIRVVFALASDEVGVTFPPARTLVHHSDTFTTFDIWCAGISARTFKQIDERNLASYQFLLERSLQPHDAFNLQGSDDPYLDEGAKVARGHQRRRMAALTMSAS
ncbi:hypothetical protein M378DRAFT_284568 [Amanita muscaria Koide BX008]|uniref:Uncharacterized protein n=1 Tax=Amanita muscaria (strain Koide BX008) TaxID=946122 RepID=A0A0C2WQQ4_AMAMK|nr:hypothetical protein M378DRAFT_284568 [Amanita muscaria Koide BX008]